MSQLEKLLEALRNSPQNARYSDARKVAEHFFGPPRQEGTSHAVFKMPWVGDPRVNLQCGDGGKAKLYQVKQLLAAIARLEEESKFPQPKRSK